MRHMDCWNIKRADGVEESWLYHEKDFTFADIGGSCRVMSVNAFDDYCELWGANGPVDAIMTEVAKHDKNAFDDLFPPRPTGYENGRGFS